MELKNFRAFEALNIDFHKNLTVIVAKNGVGKTSILDAIAIALSPFVKGFDGGTKFFSRNDVRRIKVRDTQSNEVELAFGGAVINVSAYLFGEKVIKWGRKRPALEKMRVSGKNTTVLTQLALHLQERIQTEEGGSTLMLPLVSYYGTGRLWNIEESADVKFNNTSRTIGYANCLKPSSNFETFEQWFTYWSENKWRNLVKALQANKEPVETEFDQYVKSVNRAVSLCLKISGWQEIDYDFERQTIVGIHKDHGRLPIHLLSDGVRSMIALVADIAFRATKLNPHLGAEASCKTPGIVLIDEVDMHLHPEWQQLVLGGLTAAFPEIQFIVTTHSPQVLTTVPPECIRELSREGDNVHVIIPEFSLGAESPYVLESIQGVHTRPQHLEIVQELNEYQHLIAEDQWDTPRAEVLREKLNAWGHGFEPALVKMDMDIRMRAYRRGQATR